MTSPVRSSTTSSPRALDQSSTLGHVKGLASVVGVPGATGAWAEPHGVHVELRGGQAACDGVEEVAAKVHVRDGELRLEVVDRAGANDRRNDRRVAQDEGDGQLDQADGGLFGEPGEGFGGVELALVLRQGTVEPVGQTLAGVGCRAGLLVFAAATGQPPAGEGAVGPGAIAVAVTGRMNISFDAASEDRIGRPLRPGSVQGSPLGRPLGVNDGLGRPGGVAEGGLLVLHYPIPPHRPQIQRHRRRPRLSTHDHRQLRRRYRRPQPDRLDR
jgi:hypothetical protein